MAVKRAEFTAIVKDRADRAGVALPPGIEERLFRYIALLHRWNATINLTALPLDPPSHEAVDRLLIEPLAVASRLPRIAGAWFDLGSGGGSPAIPMKFALDDLALTMVESKERKAAFLREAVRGLALSGTTVENLRFDALRDRSAFAGSAGLITVRAVRMDSELLDLCRFLLHSDGILQAFGFGGEEPLGFTAHSSGGFLRRCST